MIPWIAKAIKSIINNFLGNFTQKYHSIFSVFTADLWTANLVLNEFNVWQDWWWNSWKFGVIVFILFLSKENRQSFHMPIHLKWAHREKSIVSYSSLINAFNSRFFLIWILPVVEELVDIHLLRPE